MEIVTPASVVAVVGLLMYAQLANPKLSEAGRIMFFAGLFVALFKAAS